MRQLFLVALVATTFGLAASDRSTPVADEQADVFTEQQTGASANTGEPAAVATRTIERTTVIREPSVKAPGDEIRIGRDGVSVNVGDRGTRTKVEVGPSPSVTVTKS